MIKGKTAIIAGSGALPIAVAERLSSGGNAPFLILLRGNADKQLYAFPHYELGVADLAKLVRVLKAEKIRNIILAGGVDKRPHMRDFHCDWPTVRALPKILFALRRGDDALLRAFIRFLEGYGFHIIGAHEIMPELLAPKDVILTKKTASKAEKANIAAAAAAARALGELDIGQAAVAVSGRVVALEGAEGTDAMLERVAVLRAAGKIPPRGGVLVKMKKPQQEARADLPSIGADTVENARKAGLAGLAVEAGGSFILDAENVIKLADKYKIFIETL